MNKNYRTNKWIIEKLKEIDPTTIDWSEIRVDTPIYVSNDRDHWCKRHFCDYNGEVYAWCDNLTSWDEHGYEPWRYAVPVSRIKPNKYSIDDTFIVKITDIECIDNGDFGYELNDSVFIDDCDLESLVRAQPKPTDIIDWSHTEENTPMSLSNDKRHWHLGFFDTYRDGKIFAWTGGATPQDSLARTAWRYAELA